MRINEDIITLKNLSGLTGRTYVPPLVRVHRLIDVRIMAGSIGGKTEEGTTTGQGDGGFTPPGGINSARQIMIWDDDSSLSEE